jgi:ABC-2 type transport system permease protein
VGFGLQRSLSIAVERVRLASAARGAPMSLAPLAVEPRILYNPTLDSHIYFVPGVAATLLLVVTLVVTAMGLAREKEMGTLEQVMVTPISPTALILGKTLPYAGLGMITLGLVVTAGAWIFSVPLRGELWIIAVAGLLYLMSTLGIGLFLSTIAKNQQQAFMGAFFVIMPAILLSGFMTPIQNMPAWLRPASAFNPVRHFVDVMRGVLLKGATFEELAPQLVAMAGIGTAVFLMSALMLHRSLR